MNQVIQTQKHAQYVLTYEYILAIKYRMTMLHRPNYISYKGIRYDALISQRMGNKIYRVAIRGEWRGELSGREGREGNRRDQCGRTEEETQGQKDRRGQTLMASHHSKNGIFEQRHRGHRKVQSSSVT